MQRPKLAPSMTHHRPQQALRQLLQILLAIAVAACSQLPSSAEAYTSNHTAAGVLPVPCLPDQATALLRLKRSFTTTNDSAIFFRSWRPDTDCCRWMGVRCGYDDGRVTSLDLADRGLKSGGLEPALFYLTSLRYLNLAFNNFNGSQLPPSGFDRLTELTHLNLSSSSFSGQVPNGIGHLTNLISLDLSTRFELTELIRYVPALRIYSISFFINLVEQNLESLIAKLRNLRELNLGSVDLSNNESNWCSIIAKSCPELLVLRLPRCNISGPICHSLSSLLSLEVIDLRLNDLYGPIPDFLTSFPDLSVLQLSHNNLQGWISPAIFQHKKLVTIDLYKNFEISGFLPNFITSTRLENLDVGKTNFSGTIPTSISNLTALRRLGLSATGFYGELPSSIGMLKSLCELEISGMTIDGPMPSWIANLTALKILQISDCGLSGPIPSFVGNLTKLQKLALCECNFSGEIPSYITNLVQLQTILLYSNNFIGKMEFTAFLRNLTHLSILDLSDNHLVLVDGADNSSLASLPKLYYLSLWHCNIRNYPIFLRHQDQIIWLDLSYNQIHGAVPKWAWETFPNIPSILILANNKLTSVGYAPFLPVHTWKLDLSNNMLEGLIPIPRGPCWVLDYSNNKFSSIPSNFSNHLREATIFKASGNKLSGKISSSFCDGINIKLIDLSSNNFSGSVPSCFMGNVNGLQSLKLKENQLHGQLPDNIKEGCSFETLDFSGNWIGGKLPRSLAACKNLTVLDIGNNQISDSFPCWMNTLTRLQVLVLKSNKFFGQVMAFATSEKDTCDFPSLRILDLASNNFSGTLTKAWFTNLKSMTSKIENKTLVTEYVDPTNHIYKITAFITYKGSDFIISNILWTLVYIDISSNTLRGSIPESIGMLVMLNVLNMSRNSLTGPIPPSQLGQLSQIEALDLSFNELSGTIPQDLASLDFLSVLNLSYNKLEGRVPESPHFMTFLNGSFLGNDGLCGPLFSKECIDTTPSTVVSHRSMKKPVDIMLFLFVGIGFGVGFAIAVVMSWRIPTRK